MSENSTASTDARLVAQERLLDAVIAVAATRDRGFLDALRGVVLDTNSNRDDPPREGASALQHIAFRLNAAQALANAYGGDAS